MSLVTLDNASVPDPQHGARGQRLCRIFLDSRECDVRPYFLGKKIDLSTLAAFKPERKVSMAGLLMAAHKAGAIDDGRYKYLSKIMSMRGYRLREPPELDFPLQGPTVLKSIFDMHQSALGYSRDDLARLLHSSATDLDALYGASPDDTENIPRPRFTVLK
jgi:hypothetical protein